MMSFIRMLTSIFRAIFYRMPNVGDVYIFDMWNSNDPWSGFRPYKVKITSSEDGVVKYKLIGGDFEKFNIMQNEKFNRPAFHVVYKKVNEAEEV